MQRHLRDCGRCRGNLSELRSVRTGLLGAGPPAAPAGSSERAVEAAMASLVAGDARATSITTTSRRPSRPRRPSRSVLARQAAAAVIIAGAVGAGIVALARSDQKVRTTTAGPAQSTLPGIGGTTHDGPYGGPVAGTPVLQLRREIRPVSCGRAGGRGQLDGASPSPAKDAVVAATGSGRGCILLGPAFATLSSANVTHVSLHDDASGTVAVSIRASTSAVTSAGALDSAASSGSAIALGGGGVDLGHAVIGKGPTIHVIVSRAVAETLTEDFR